MDTNKILRADGSVHSISPKNGKDYKLEEIYDLLNIEMVEVVCVPGYDSQIMLTDEEGIMNGKRVNVTASILAGQRILGDVMVIPTDMFR